MKGPKKGSIKARNRNRIYWPNCRVCQYMKMHPDFRLAVLNSTYFNPDGLEPLVTTMKRYSYPYPKYSMYAHIRAHQQKDLERKAQAEALRNEEDKKKHDKLVKLSQGPVVVDGVPLEVLGSDRRSAHEIGLDDFIRLGHEKLKRGEMTINTDSWLKAIATRVNIDKANKDRKVDVFKTMFAGAAPSGDTGQHTGQE